MTNKSSTKKASKPSELKVERTHYGWRVQLPIDSAGAQTETNLEAQRVDSDPYGRMRLITVTDFNTSDSKLAILTYALYHRISGNWKATYVSRFDYDLVNNKTSCKSFDQTEPLDPRSLEARAFEMLLEAK